MGSYIGKQGQVVRHKATGNLVVLSTRKADRSGWWNTDGSGLSDHALLDTGDWELLDDSSVLWIGPTSESPGLREQSFIAPPLLNVPPGTRVVVSILEHEDGSRG